MSLERPSIPLLPVGWRPTTLGNSGCKVTTQLMLHRDHRTFGKHRSCKHPIHIPLRSCHVNLVICVEGTRALAVLGFLSSLLSYFLLSHSDRSR
ncbi:hypothetical protein EV363DRAFT_1400056 [Boletus edulis]|nr:hypothetical protein EV363DRAFT_1400056 [Boletus edulis]